MKLPAQPIEDPKPTKSKDAQPVKPIATYGSITRYPRDDEIEAHLEWLIRSTGRRANGSKALQVMRRQIIEHQDILTFTEIDRVLDEISRGKTLKRKGDLSV